MNICRTLAVGVASSVFALAGTVAAQPTASPPTAPLPTLEKRADTSVKSLEWHYDRFRTSEYVATGVLALGLVATTSFWKDDEARWRGGVLLDGTMMSLGRGDSDESRVRAAKVSDVMLYSMFAWPYLDAGVALARGNAETAWQMSLINAQSHALNGLITMIIKRAVRRERPWVSAQCDTPEEQKDPRCRDSASFLSGHSSTAFTSAGLVCAHHQALPLYGNKIGDTLACVTAVAAASTTAALRVVADKHYTSDVFAGAALGLASGYLLPKILHYGGFSRSVSSDQAKKRPLVAWSAAPMAMPGGAFISIGGAFR